LKHHLLLVKALLLLQRGRGDEALKQCEAALKIRDNALTQYLRSLALFATRRDDEGFQALQRAYDLKEGIEPPKEILLRELLRNWSLMALCLGVFGALAQKPAELEKPVAEYIRVVDNAKAERLEDAVIDVPLPKKFSSYLWGEYERQFRDGCFHAGLPVTQEAVAEVRQQFQEAVEELELAVRLLSIKDPFEGWRALTKEISKVWPEGVSALDAIREQRDREWNK
jgi:tetratricopeptide (TPR) repeat protein